MASEYVPVVGDEVWYDRWQNAAGDVVTLPTSNRTAYARAGLTLLEGHAYDIRYQMAADGNAARNRGLTSDRGGAVYPAAFPAVGGPPPSKAPAPASETPFLEPLVP